MPVPVGATHPARSAHAHHHVQKREGRQKDEEQVEHPRRWVDLHGFVNDIRPVFESHDPQQSQLGQRNISLRDRIDLLEEEGAHRRLDIEDHEHQYDDVTTSRQRLQQLIMKHRSS